MNILQKYFLKDVVDKYFKEWLKGADFQERKDNSDLPEAYRDIANALACKYGELDMKYQKMMGYLLAFSLDISFNKKIKRILITNKKSKVVYWVSYDGNQFESKYDFEDLIDKMKFDNEGNTI